MSNPDSPLQYPRYEDWLHTVADRVEHITGLSIDSFERYPTLADLFDNGTSPTEAAITIIRHDPFGSQILNFLDWASAIAAEVKRITALDIDSFEPYPHLNALFDEGKTATEAAVTIIRYDIFGAQLLMLLEEND